MNSSLGVSAGAARGWGSAGGAAAAAAGLASVLGGLCVAAVAGNLLLLAVLLHQLRRGHGCPAGQAWLLSLCAADLLLALACLPARIAAAAARRAWPLGAVLCRATDWLLHGCLVAKSLSWAAAGQAHLRHLRAPPPPGPGWGGGRLAGLLSALWLSALLLPLPVLLFTRLEGGPEPRLLRCVFRSPADAANFMDVFSKVYPLVAYLAPSGFTWACYGRALRLQKARQRRLAKPGRQSPKATRTLLALSLLFQAMWLPEWVVWLWLWERRGPLGGGPAPPPALVLLAEVLLFLNCSFNPGGFAASSEEFRQELKSLWAGLRCGRGKEGSGGARAGETPQALQDLPGEAAAEKVLPDVAHFWKDRRNAAAGEESDPIPWEHQCDP